MASTDYIHLYETVAEFNEEYSAENYHEPWVSFTIEGSGLSYNKTEEEKMRESYLTFKIISAGTIYFGSKYSNEDPVIIEYKKNDGEWVEITSTKRSVAPTYITASGETDADATYYYSGQNESLLIYTGNGKTVEVWVDEGSFPQVGGDASYRDGTGYHWLTITSVSGEYTGDMGTPINVSTGDIVQFRGDNPYYGGYGENTFSFSTCICNVNGNVMSLLDSENFKEMTSFDSSATNYSVFLRLFSNMTGLTNASKLYIPVIDLSEFPDCYNGMFSGCISLTGAPNLPATTLGDECYYNMFSDCTSLTTPPKLPATTLANNCYNSMFAGCRSLTQAPALPATTLAENCYNSMFQGCSSITTAPALPATTLANSCYYCMFSACTSLVTPPVLPATSLENASHCYSSMFSHCTSLTTAPELPATTLETSCYNAMFSYCTSLTAAPDLPATTLAAYCYQNLFNGCSNLISGPRKIGDENTSINELALKYMFSGCTSLAVPPELPSKNLDACAYRELFMDCVSLTTAPALPLDGYVPNYAYKGMFKNCTSLVNPPVLPASGLGIECYSEMFKGCTSLVTAPELPAITLYTDCYKQMFSGCTSLNYIKALFTTTPSTLYTRDWVNGVSATGTFVKNSAARWSVTGVNGIPNGWTVQTA